MQFQGDLHPHSSYYLLSFSSIIPVSPVLECSFHADRLDSSKRWAQLSHRPNMHGTFFLIQSLRWPEKGHARCHAFIFIQKYGLFALTSQYRKKCIGTLSVILSDCSRSSNLHDPVKWMTLPLSQPCNMRPPPKPSQALDRSWSRDHIPRKDGKH